MIPIQNQGKSVDCFSSAEFDDIDSARQFFSIAKHRLLDINNWNNVATLPSSTFQLCNSDGTTRENIPHEDNLIKIDIVGPGLPSSGGYDWVRIEQILEEQQSDGPQVSMTLRPTTDPTNQNKDIAHFLQNVATSTFVLKQINREVSVHYAGRNEIINLENKAILDNVRNALVGLGIYLGGSFPQWQSLVDGFVKVE